MTDETDSSLMSFLQPMESESGSPPVDDQSIKNTMDKNKESLKVKLMLRRPINQLIDQGILPPLRTSPGFHSQRQKLERAKTGDLLKHKIQRRPQRQELIEQHILEDTTVDPSLHEKQRQLKKARLADDLNDRLSHRPGPLELIKGNILHTVEPFEQAVKEGQIPFKKTSEGEVVKHPPPRFIFTNEEESSSDSASSPLINSTDQSLSGLITFEAPTDVSNVPTIVATSAPPTTVSYIVSSPVTSILTSPSTVHSILIGNGNAVAIAAPTPIPSVVAVTSATTSPIINGTPFSQTPNQISVNPSVVSNFKEHSSSSKCRKKSKSKAQPKARTIKFHEYKGPPNAKSPPNSSQSSAESSYELLLQQQQLFLQWQLEWQQKYPQIILPTTQTISDQIQEQGTDAQNGNQSNQKCGSTQMILKSSFQSKPINQNATNNESNSSMGSPRDRSNSNASTTQSKFNASVVGKIISKLEDMKVSDLKAELKKRNLPVSGAKQQLIDRLKPFADAVLTTAAANSSFLPMNLENMDSKLNMINADAIKTESNADSMVMSPTIDSNSNEVKTEQMDIKSPENDVMEVDSIVEDVDQNCSMDLGNDCLTQKTNTNQTNDEIVLIQQQKISELQRELHKSQMQLHLQQTAVLPIESQTVAIPLTNGPQIHIISAQNNEPSIDCSAQKSLQRQLLQQHLQQKLQQNLNIRPQQTNGNETNLATILTNATISPSVKASLAAFLQSQQQQQQTLTLSSPPTPQQTLTTKLLTNSSVTPIQQFVLCPSVCATTETDPSEPDSAKQRTNSLPNGLCHRFLSQSSQRTSSLPNFNTIITSQSPTESKHRTEEKPSFVITKCPPNYEEAIEATKQTNKIKDKKKSVKSQAVDDVLEILIKNGELPPSAAQDPTTPTTPEKLLALSAQNNPIFTKEKSVQNSCETKPKESIDKNNDNNNNINNNINNNKKNINNSNNISDNKSGAHNTQTLDFDFILDLEGLAEAMDLNVAINEKSLKSDKFSNNDNKNNNINNNNNNNNCINSNNNDNSFATHSNRTKTGNNSELSLSEFMDFQDCNLNVDDNHWMEMASTSMPSNEQNMMQFNETDDQNHSDINFDGNNNTNSAQTSVNPSAIKSGTSKHDPILPNTMFGGNLIDPLGDLFFDDTDFKSSLDLGSLMWDKVDFAT